jgi:23S rRNA pseudouridine2605 synthase
MSEERLQKLMARAGVASRRKAEELIREARVTINGRAAEIGDKADLERDAVKVDGKRLQPHAGAHHYLLLNKPKYVMSTLADPEGRTTVIDLVPPRLRKALVPVGRLDYNTEGLLLLTDDGELAQQVAHPRYGCVKTYEVKVKGQPTDADLDRLRGGIVLDGKRTAPCRITARHVPRRAAESENSWWKVELSQGRSRQIREMFQRVGHPVQKLRRVAIGPVADPDLPLGMVRELTEREVEMLRAAATRATRKSAGGKAAAGGGKAAAGGGKAKAAPRAKPARIAPSGARPARSKPSSTKPSRSKPSGTKASRGGLAKPGGRAGGGERRATRGPGGAARTPRSGRPRSRG